MAKKSIFLVITIIIVASIILIGCSEEEEGEATPTPEPTATATIEATPTEVPEATPNETVDNENSPLSDILGLIGGVNSVRYDAVLTIPDEGTFTTRTWLKGKKMKTETTSEGETVINIIDLDAQTSITYMPEQGLAIEFDFADAPEPATETTEDIEQYDPTIIGIEVIDGHECTVIEYTVEGSSIKMWIEKAHGFPIRIETTTSEGTMIMEYKNIDFSAISDNEFELPEGVEIMELPF